MKLREQPKIPEKRSKGRPLLNLPKAIDTPTNHIYYNVYAMKYEGWYGYSIAMH